MQKKQQPDSSWFRYDQLPLSAPNVANAAPGVATSVSPLWNTNIPLLPAMSQNPMLGLQKQIVDHDTTAETPTATTASGADENDDDPDDEHEYVNTETDKNIESKKRYR